ncbi:MAG: hypothetical protein QOI24_2605 [Acidobacteriota bacterium]|jgi:hypothetical protein|nr:hypothetical protein [Acidobacteriota bacterium]
MNGRRRLLVFVAVAAVYVLPGMWPGRILAPADVPRDLLAWKSGSAERVRVSNSLLSDVPTQNIAWDAEARRHLANGNLPWRNEFAADGEQLFANPITALLSPFTWPRLLLGLHGWSWSILLKLLVSMFSMWWLARVVGASDVAAIVSAIAWALAGFFIVWALWQHTNVYPLFPALAAACITLAREPSPKRALALALIAALATAGGHPESLLITVVAIAIFLFLNRDATPRVAGAALGGFLALGVQLVPFAIVFLQSHVRHSRSEMLGFRFHKLSLLAQLLPGFLGSPLRGELDLTGAFPNAENFHQRSGAYIGAIALIAIVLAWRSLAPPFRRALAIAAVAWLLTLYVPGITHVLRAIPIVGLVAPEYFAVPAVLFAALAAGPALIEVTSGITRRRLGIAVIIIGAMLIIGGALPTIAPNALARAARAGIARLQSRGALHQPAAVYEQRLAYYLDAAKWTAARRIAIPGVCWLLFGVALTMRAGRMRTRLAIGALTAELIAFGAGFNPSIRIDEIAPEPPMIAEVKRLDPAHRWLIAAPSEVFPPNLGTIYGVRDVHAYDILTSEAYTRKLLPAGYDPKRWAFPLNPTPEQLHYLSTLGVRYWLSPNGIVEMKDAIPPALPSNAPPEGIVLGLVVSALGIALAAYVAIASRSRPA